MLVVIEKYGKFMCVVLKLMFSIKIAFKMKMIVCKITSLRTTKSVFECVLKIQT